MVNAVSRTRVKGFPRQYLGLRVFLSHFEEDGMCLED